MKLFGSTKSKIIKGKNGENSFRNQWSGINTL